ncbi:hypothetical protein G3B51_005309 [Salmonella enterica]|nr:hypothetical protein [Salmonella enterica]EGG5311412.1 hypothetical protein [Salmonella enterica]
MTVAWLMKMPVLRGTDFIYSVAIKETLAGYNSEVSMKGLDLERMTPEKIHGIGLECIRRAKAMEESGATKDAIRKNLLPAMQRMERARYELQSAFDRVIDKTAELEKCEADVRRMLNKIVGQGTDSDSDSDSDTATE